VCARARARALKLNIQSGIKNQDISLQS